MKEEEEEERGGREGGLRGGREKRSFDSESISPCAKCFLPSAKLSNFVKPRTDFAGKFRKKETQGPKVDQC